jgi:hypothetical protein
MKWFTIVAVGQVLAKTSRIDTRLSGRIPLLVESADLAMGTDDPWLLRSIENLRFQGGHSLRHRCASPGGGVSVSFPE